MLEFMDKHRRAVVAILFVILAVTGLLMLPKRAAGGDESIETHTLSLNMKAYVDLLLPEDSALRQSMKDEISIDEWRDREYGQARSYAVWPLMEMAESMKVK